MKKKLLSILLAVFMMVTSFTTRTILADEEVTELSFSLTPITKSDFSNLPSVDGNIETVLNEVVPRNFSFYLFNEDNKLIDCYNGSWKDGSYDGESDFSDVAYVIEEIDFATEFSFAETMTIKVNDGKPLDKILDSKLHTGVEGYIVKDGVLYIDVKVYSSLKTIADILPINFPANDEDESWCNSKENGVYIYNDGTYLVFAKAPVTNAALVSSVLTKAEKDPTWSDTTTCRLVYSTDDIIIQFNMTGDDGNELENIVVAYSLYEACEGTYGTYSVTYEDNGATSGKVPDVQTKTAGVGLTLATNTGNLAKAGYTFVGWNTQDDGKGTHYDAGETYTTDAALTLYAEWVAATKTIADILDKAVGGFPTSQSNAWVDPSYDYIAYKSNNLLYIQEKSSISILTFIDVNKNVSKVSDSQYKYHDSTGNYDVLFNLNSNNKLVSIELTGISDYRSVLNRTYEAPKTIADILPEDFPSTTTDDAPEDAWVNSNGNKAYINKNNELQLIGIPSTFNINTVLTKVDNNYTTTNMGTILTFKMKSGVLKEIESNFMSAISTFAPYKIENAQNEATSGSTEDMEFITNANYQSTPSNVTVKVQLEGETSPTTLTYGTDYSLQTGSTIVKLKGDYVKTLPIGTHTISIAVAGYKEVSQNFKITTVPTPTPTPTPKPGYVAPKTGIN